jgi:hypothetical protein
VEKKALQRAAKAFFDEQYRLRELGLPTIANNDDCWLDTFVTRKTPTMIRISFSFE